MCQDFSLEFVFAVLVGLILLIALLIALVVLSRAQSERIRYPFWRV